MDGKPVEGALVSFVPDDSKSRSAVGTTDAQGNFKLTTEVNGDGALPGSYKISITKWDRPPLDLPEVKNASDSAAMDAIYTAKEKMGKQPPAKNAIAAQFANAAGSGLTATVKESGTNEFKFEVRNGK
jgi:hypothetical protein